MGSLPGSLTQGGQSCALLAMELDERVTIPVAGASHRPELIGGWNPCHRVKFTHCRAWAGDDAPTGAIPVFDHRCTVGKSHGPDVAGGDGCYPGRPARCAVAL